MTLEQIKKKFEHPDYFYRWSFISEYDFDDDYSEYYRNFIIQNTRIKAHVYLSELIDLAAYLEFYDRILIERYLNYLFEKRHTIVKLSSLDYLRSATKENHIEEKGIDRLHNARSRFRRRILINDITISLLIADHANRQKHLEFLLTSIKKTWDWKSIYRVLNVFSQHEELKHLRGLLYQTIYNLHKRRSFGEGVDEALNKFAKWYFPT